MRVEGSRALRALVAELALLGDEDLQAILDDLDALARTRLLGMIDRFRSGEGVAVPAALTPASTADLGDWLLTRLNPRNPEATGMTPHALQALRQAARESGWSSAAPVTAAPGPRGLLGRLGMRP